MCDLEKRIEQWRADLTASEAISPTDVAELETHLREELARLRASGLPEDEAFVIASHRLGDRFALEPEFAKAHPHRRLLRRLHWIVVGILGYALITYLTVIVSCFPIWLGYFVGLRSAQFLMALGFISRAGCFATLAWYALTYYRARAQRTPRQVPVSLRAGILMAVAVAVLSWFPGLPVLILRWILPPRDLNTVHNALLWGGQAWSILMPFLLAAAMVALSRSRSTTAQRPVVSEPTVKGRERVQSLSRDQIERLTDLGLSVEEAVLLGRRRLDIDDRSIAAIAEDYSSQPLYHAFYWMALGILGYLWTTGLAELASGTSVWLGYSAGAGHAWLLLVSGAAYASVFAAAGLFLWRHAASSADAVPSGTWAVGVVGLLLAGSTVLWWQIINAAPGFLSRSMSDQAFLQVMRAWSWAGTGRFLLLPFLLAAALAVLSIRWRRVTAVQ